MKKAKTAAGLATAGVFLAGFGATVLPASAQQRVLRVTLLGGQVVTVTVDAPAGTPADQIALPGITTPVVGVEDVSPPAQAPAPQPPAQQPAPAQQEAPAADPEAPKAASGAEDQGSTGKDRRPARKRGGSGDEAPTQEASPSTADKAKETAAEAAEAAAAGVPTPDDPTFSLAEPGPAPIGVPNFFIEKFRIPPFLLPIYQAAGIEYGVRWEILAAINEIETDYGRNLNVSSAGALGWMQFMPATWKAYGTDANRDGRKDPYNPVDAIFAAARYLRAAGAEDDLRKAIFAYNHADWYVDSVLLRARLISGIPADLVGSLTGLTQGHFPVHAKARYADDLSARDAERKIAKGRNAAIPIEPAEGRRGIDVFAEAGSPAIAVQDGRIVKIGRNERLGRFVMLRDVYGNTYTYARLGEVADAHPVPKEQEVAPGDVRRELDLPAKDPKPTAPASAGMQKGAAAPEAVKDLTAPAELDAGAKAAKERLFANPARPGAFQAGGEDQLLEVGAPLGEDDTFKTYFTQRFGLKRDDVVLKRLEVGSKVIAGTVLGRLGQVSRTKAPHLLFEVRPAGRGAPRIDPKPILDGWKLLESTAVYRAAGKNPFFGPDAKNPSIGQILLMSKEALQRRVLGNPRIELYDCGRRDVKAGIIDRRVLASLEFLAASGLRPSVTSLRCGHSFLTASGNVSHHSSGNAVDIAKVNGVPVIGNQGRGSVTDLAVRRLLTLQGTMRPSQIISLMTYEGADNTLALPDHADHIHLGFAPLYDPTSKRGREMEAILKPGQWIKLIDRLGAIDNPVVPTKPSKYAIEVDRHSDAHKGE